MHIIFSEVQSYQLCDGVKDSVVNTSVNAHFIPFETDRNPVHSSNPAKTVNWSSDCRMLLNEYSKCGS